MSKLNNDPKYANNTTFEIEPTADSIAFIGSAVRAASYLWRDGYKYAKAGVIFVDLSRKADLPPRCFPAAIRSDQLR